MTTDDLQYRAIIEICQKSQEIMNGRLKEVGLRQATAEINPYDSMWEAYSKRITKPVELRHADFSGLLFKQARFENHNFIECDFNGSRWVFSQIKNSNCAGSNFSGIHAILNPFTNTNCTSCDFTNAEIHFFDPLSRNNFENADFTNAKLNTAHSFFEDEKLASRARFENAIMNGCRLTIKREEQPQFNRTKRELRSLLDKIFSPDQLAVMHIDYEAGCFIATAACGLDSEEVRILRHFRDAVLLNGVLGRLFVRTYYRISPPIASLIESSPKARYLIRNVIVRPVARLVDRNKGIKAGRLLLR